jgi:hypothetical protein
MMVLNEFVMVCSRRVKFFALLGAHLLFVFHPAMR